MERIKLADGVHMSKEAAEKFKRCRVVLHFIWPSTRANATAEAVLPMIMERSYADCPDMTELSKKLAGLYGAALSVDLSVSGANRVLSVGVSGIRDIYALSDEELSRSYAEVVLGVAFRPYLVNGKYDETDILIEREQLREQLQSEINDKRTYCVRQARRRFYKGAPQGIEKNGYIEEIDELSPESVTNAWLNIIETARIEVMVLGADCDEVKNSVLEALKNVNRAPVDMVGISAMERIKTEEHKEEMDIVQGKLCMFFTSGKPMSGRDLSVLRVASALFGGTATSRLFLNVREKQSLCYYCAAYSDGRNGALCIDSGVEHENAKTAKEAILKELKDLCEGEITQKELQETKLYLTQRLQSIEDLLDGIEAFYFSEILKGTNSTPTKMIEEINSVTQEEVKEILKRFSLSLVYLLTKEANA